MMNKLTLRDLQLTGKRVLMRVDFNVPLNPDHVISDDFRIQQALDSIHYVIEQRGKLILLSHLGDPKSERNLHYSLAPCAKRLSEILNLPVQFSHDCVGHSVKDLVGGLEEGEILLLENLRFHPEEESPSMNPSFANGLAELGDLYVNDAFGSSHRNHTSITQLPLRFPGQAAAGFLMEKEIEMLAPLRENPERPFYLLLGGSKISSKIGLIHGLLSHLDGLFIGGTMAFPFLKARGHPVGSSPCDDQDVSLAKQILRETSLKVFLPEDIVAVHDTSLPPKTFPIEEIPNGWTGRDIGPRTLESWKKTLTQAATVFWNGPLGMFEMPPFDTGTRSLVEWFTQNRLRVLIGGGDSAFCVREMGFANCIDHLSTGGGATLAFLEQGHLPGIDALSDK